jgi:hypothetical protein
VRICNEGAATKGAFRLFGAADLSRAAYFPSSKSSARPSELDTLPKFGSPQHLLTEASPHSKFVGGRFNPFRSILRSNDCIAKIGRECRCVPFNIDVVVAQRHHLRLDYSSTHMVEFVFKPRAT